MSASFRKVVSIFSVAGLAVATFSSAPAMSTEPERGGAEEVASVVSQLTPEGLSDSDVAAISDGSSFRSTGEVPVIVPVDPEKPLVIAPEERGVSARVEIFVDSILKRDGVLAEDGSVVFVGEDISQTVQATEEGVRINTVILSAGAPEEIRHDLNLPEGFSLVTGSELEKLTPSGAASEPLDGVFILDANNELVGGVSAPWAVDANGVPIHTQYAVEGEALIQYVHHRDLEVSYPIVADPWLGFDLISSAHWERRSEGWTLKVSPTGWARANAPGYAVGVAGWNELYEKYRNKGLVTNLGGMRDQYICHQQFAAWKSTWNLDEWCPDVSYTETVNSKCNPGGGKIID